MLVLIVAVLAFVSAPLLYQWLKRGGYIAKTLDRVLALALAAIIVLALLPETLTELGLLGVLLIVLGYSVPGLLEMGLKQAARATHIVTLLIAVFGLGLHSLLDGAALAGDQYTGYPSLSIAILLHRFTVGMVAWFILRQVFNRQLAAIILTLIALATVAGYFLAESILVEADHLLPAYLQAVIVGTLVHGLVHRGHVGEHSGE